mgnify:CR=1 FL=1
MMNKLLLLFFLTFIFGNYIAQEDIKWLSWQEMMKERTEDSVKKKVFIDLYTGWCGWCKRMDATTFKNPSISQYMNQKYYPVKFDAETRDTIVFNNHQFINSDPSYIKKAVNSRGKVNWFANSILDGKLSYPSYVILDEDLVRLMIYKGFKQEDELLGILLFFGSDQYKNYHNFLNSQWANSLQKNNSKSP